MFDLLNKFIVRPWNVLKWRFVIVLWKYLNLEINTTFKSDFQIFNFKLRNYISVRSTPTWTAVLKPVQSTQVRFFMWFFSVHFEWSIRHNWFLYLFWFIKFDSAQEFMEKHEKNQESHWNYLQFYFSPFLWFCCLRHVCGVSSKFYF